MRIRHILFVLTVAALPCVSALAQTDIDTTVLTSRILPPAPPTPTGVSKTLSAMNEEQIQLKYLFAPLFLSTDGAWLAQATAGIIRPTTLATRLTFSYTYIDPDGSSDHLDNFGVALRQGVFAHDRGGVNIVASYADTRNAATKTQVGAAGEALFGSGFSGGADVRWVTSSGGDGVDDIVPRVFGAVERGRFTFAADYTLENDVDEADDYSAEVDITTSRGIVVLGAGKNSTWYVNFVKVF